MNKIQLGVIFGSRSCEHEVSIISAVQLMRAVDLSKYDLIPIYISQNGVWYTGEPLKNIGTYTPFNENTKGITQVQLDCVSGSGALLATKRTKGLFAKEEQTVVARLDCVIPVMHGMHGEDGTLQGMLEMCNLPYTSSGVGACSMGMDKTYMKQYFIGCGFPVLPSTWVLRKTWQNDRESIVDKIEKTLEYPIFVKPASLGSSIGVTCAKSKDELIEAMDLAFEFDRKVLVEKGLTNMLELNCSVLGYNDEVRASEIEMPLTEGDILDFTQKYGNASTKGMASLKRILPAPIEDSLKERMQELSIEIFKAMDCKGVVRIDFMYDSDSNNIYITEINTIPGSLSFYLWEKSGLSYSMLIDEMVRFAMEAQQDKEDNNFAYHSDILKNIGLGGKTGTKHQGKVSV